LAFFIADADVKMKAMKRNRAGQTYDLKISGTFLALRLISKTDMIVCEAAHGASDPAGLDAVCSRKRSYFLSQVFTRL
jgi:hypothetical protein